eukprot:363542-Chlamydomonas_euryale.AAC.3
MVRVWASLFAAHGPRSEQRPASMRETRSSKQKAEGATLCPIRRLDSPLCRQAITSAQPCTGNKKGFRVNGDMESKIE